MLPNLFMIRAPRSFLGRRSLTIQGKFDVSLKLSKDAMAIAEEVLGSEHPTIGNALNNQAVVLVALVRGPEGIF